MRLAPRAVTLAGLVAAVIVVGSGVAKPSSPSAMERTLALLKSGQETVRVVCFGDSITGVYYHTGGRRAWCDMLGIALGRMFPKAKLEMFNAGISGNTSAQGLARIEKDVLARRPHIVVVMFGMNDCARASRAQFEANLAAIVKRCQDSGAAVVLCTPNSVYANTPRPIQRLAEYAQTVRQVAKITSTPLADCYAAYEQTRAKNPIAWMLLMSETIHPSMNGHRLFAEVMAQAISGQRVSLDDVKPPEDALRSTLKRLRSGQPVSVIASPPYDRIVPEALRQLFPNVKIDVTSWPTQGQSLAQIEQWAKDIRRKAPTLVIVSVPATAAAENDEAFIRSYAWVLNWSIDFSRLTWDRLVIVPSVTGPVASEQKRFEELARQVIIGADANYLDRAPNDTRPAAAIVLEWVQRQAAIIKPEQHP